MYFLILSSISIVGYIYRKTIVDKLLFMYASYNKIERHNKYEVEKFTLYDDNNKLINNLKYLPDYNFDELKNDNQNLEYIEIQYTYLGKRFRIIYNENFSFPPYSDDLAIKEGYKYLYLTCTSDKDETERINMLLGPKNNFYEDVNLEIPTKYITNETLSCLDNNMNEYNMDEILKIKN